MCGILAFLGNYNLELLNKCLEKIKMRGPDNSSLTQIDKNIFFGFHRLSINGLDSISNQPLYYKTPYVIAAKARSNGSGERIRTQIPILT